MPDLTPVQIRTMYEKGPEGAIAYLESLGIEITWDWKEQHAAIKKRAFTIAKVAKADALQTVHNELKKAQNSGVSYEQIQKQTDEILKQKGYATKDDGSAWRLDTIIRTNMQSAYHAGRYERMTAASDRFGYWEYRAVGDKRSRPKHRELDGLILPRDHPLWKKIFPPNGFKCRCSATALTEKQALARGYKPPKNGMVTTPSGQKVKVEGPGAWEPDEGFLGVPGQPLDPDLAKYEPPIKAALKKDLAKQAQTKPLAQEQPPAPEPKKAQPKEPEFDESAVVKSAATGAKTADQARQDAIVEFYRQKALKGDAKKAPRDQILEWYEQDVDIDNPTGREARRVGASAAQLFEDRQAKTAPAKTAVDKQAARKSAAELNKKLEENDQYWYTLEKVKQEYSAKGQKVNIHEIASINHYTSTYYESLNAALRSGKPDAHQQALTQSLSDGIRKMAKPHRELNRVIKISAAEERAFLKKHAEGNVVEVDAFMSTTRTEVNSPSFEDFKGNVLIKLRGEWKSGADVKKFSDVPEENEVLFAPGTKMKVERVIEMNDESGTWYQVEVTEVR